MKLNVNSDRKNKFYVNNSDIWISCTNKDFNVREPARVRIIQNGYILPVKGDYLDYKGGVLDAEKNFVAGHISQIDNLKKGSYKIFESYKIEHKVPHMDEIVVYGGVVSGHYGHFIIEFLSRMWWHLENRDCAHKFVFIMPDAENYNKVPFMDFFNLLGIREEQLILLKAPMRFSSIIVPDQTTYNSSGFNDKAVSVYNAIRDSVVPAHYDKIYLTRTRLKNKDCINEEYFENFYHSLGYEIISPEQLSIKEQVSIMAGAKKVVCISGSLHHQILFCHDGVDITVLNRLDHCNNVLTWINQMRFANFTCIDVHLNFLPHTFFASCYLLYPTLYWKQYIKDSLFMEIDDTQSPSLTEAAIEYMKKWAEIYSDIGVLTNLVLTDNIHGFSFATLIINLNKYLLENELDEMTCLRIKNVFSDDRLPKEQFCEIDKIRQEAAMLRHAMKHSRWIKLGRRLGFLKGL